MAALIVVSAHLGAPFRAANAVCIFFMLSGIVMERSFSNTNSIEFIRLRLKRLYPLYALGTLLGAFAIMHHKVVFLDDVYFGHPSLANLAKATVMGVFMIPSNTLVMFPLDVPAWSLYYEILVNIIWCLRLNSVMIFLICATCAFMPFGHFTMAFEYFFVGVLLERLTPSENIMRGGWLCVANTAFALMFGPQHSVILDTAIVWWAAHSEVGKIGSYMGRYSYPVYILHFPIALMLLP